MRKIFGLFFTMLKIGLFTFGGGYAMLALLEDEFVSKKQWLDKDEFLDMAVIAESTPGPIAINAATYIGYKSSGFFGALVATLGVCIPSFLIIYAISLFLDAFLSLTYVAYAFRGIQVGVIYLIMSAGIKMFGQLEKNALSVTLFCVTVLCFVMLSLLAVSFSTVFYILIGGAVGLSIYLVALVRRRGKGEDK